MRQRLLWIGGLTGLVLGLVLPASAAVHRPGISKPPKVRSVRASAPHRQRHRASSEVLESLDLPRPAPLFGAMEVRAAAAVLMDGETGDVLFEWNPDEPRPPASTTKILTALVVLEQGRLTDSVVVSQGAARVGGYRLGLRRGQRVSLGDLLAAILIRSANDAAVAAAEHVGGSLPGFVAMMNAKAVELGMRHSHFANPHGLDDPAHFATARDMALLTRAALQHRSFAELVRTREATLTIWQQASRRLVPQTRVVQSHNKLLGRLEGADGVKTGYTEAAGQCLVASASRGGQRMIAVLLDDPQRWTDAAMLLEFGFVSAGGAARVPTPGRPWRATSVEGGHG